MSPSLFILASEVASRGLNYLAATKQIGTFSAPRNCPIITHLAFADDIIIFTNRSRTSLTKLMDFLAQYERESGHLINKHKSCFVVGFKVDATGFVRKALPLKYLGCQLFVGRNKA